MPTLAEAITAIKSGRLNEGRLILARILASDDQNITALLWMTEVAATPEEVRRYLNRVLAIDPHNIPARKGLELLDKANEAQPLEPTPESPVSPPAPAEAVGDQGTSSSEGQLQEATAATPPPAGVSTPQAKWTTGRKMIVAVIVAIAVLMIVAVALSAVSRSQQEQSALSALAAIPQSVPTEQKAQAPTPNPYPALAGLQEYPWINALDLVKRPEYYKNKPVCLDEMIVFDAHQDRGVTTFGIQSSSGDATVSGTVVYAGTIPDLANNFNIILGGYVVGTEADLNLSSSSRPVILMQRYHSYNTGGMFSNFTAGDESAMKCKPPEK